MTSPAWTCFDALTAYFLCDVVVQVSRCSFSFSMKCFVLYAYLYMCVVCMFYIYVHITWRYLLFFCFSLCQFVRLWNRQADLPKLVHLNFNSLAYSWSNACWFSVLTWVQPAGLGSDGWAGLVHKTRHTAYKPTTAAGQIFMFWASNKVTYLEFWTSIKGIDKSIFFYFSKEQKHSITQCVGSQNLTN